MTGNPELMQQALQQGHEAALHLRWEQAARLYTQAAAENPENAAARGYLAMSLLASGRLEEALAAYRETANLSPGESEPLERAASILGMLGRKEEAIAALLTAVEYNLRAENFEKTQDSLLAILRLDQMNLNALAHLAKLYERQGCLVEAVNENLRMASLLQQKGETAKAIQMVEECMAAAPESIEALQALDAMKAGQSLPIPFNPFYEKLEEDAGAPAGAGEPVEEARHNALAQLISLLLPADLGERLKLPVTPWDKTRKLGGTTSTGENPTFPAHVLTALNQALDAQSRREPETSVKMMERAVELGLNHPAAHFLCGLEQKIIHPDRAMMHLRFAARQPDFEISAAILLGQIQMKNGQAGEGVAFHIQALAAAEAAVFPSQAGWLRLFYQPVKDIHRRQASEERAAALSKTILRQLQRGYWREYLVRLRSIVPGKLQGKPARPLLEYLSEPDSDEVVDMLSAIQQHLEEKKFPLAMEEALHALHKAPSSLLVQETLGEVMAEGGDYTRSAEKALLVAQAYVLRGEGSRAVQTLRTMIGCAPGELTLRQRLVEVLLGQGQQEAAVQETVSLGQVYYQLAELDKARQTYLNALRLAEKLTDGRKWGIEVFHRMADIDMQRLDWRQALRIYEQIRRLQPDELDTHARVVDLNFRLGQDAAAMSELERSIAYLENKDRHSEAYSLVARLISEKPEKTELRRKLVELAVVKQKMGEVVLMLDGLADRMCNDGNRIGAIALLETILLLKPANVAEYQKVLDGLK